MAAENQRISNGENVHRKQSAAKAKAMAYHPSIQSAAESGGSDQCEISIMAYQRQWR